MEPPTLDEIDRFLLQIGANAKGLRKVDSYHGILNQQEWEDNVFGFNHTTHGVTLFLVMDCRRAVKNEHNIPMADMYIFDSELNRLVNVGRPSVYGWVPGTVDFAGFEKQIVRANGARKQFLGKGWW